MRRREFVALVGGAAAAWPLEARAQQSGRMRRIAVLTGGSENDPTARVHVPAFREGLAKLGWVEGRNLRTDLRFGAGDPNGLRALVAELASLAPDVIVTGNVLATRAAQQQTRTTPIVFAAAGDPVRLGLVGSLARPKENITGFASLYPSVAGKWLELLKEAAPRITRVAVIHYGDFGSSYLSSIEMAAPVLGVQAIQTPFRNALELVRAVDTFAADQNGGLLTVPPIPSVADRETIRRLAVQHRLPAIYSDASDVIDGGLMGYGSDSIDRYRRVASYVDRILRGEKPADLPVQYPTKFELVINLKTAKAIGLTIPEAFLLRADEVIE